MTAPAAIATSDFRGAAIDLQTIDYFGIKLVDVDMSLLVHEADAAIVNRKPLHIIGLNPHLFQLTRVDAEFRRICESTERVIVDGVGVALTGSIGANSIPKRYSGLDLMGALCDLSDRRGYRIFFLGGREGAAKACAERLKSRYKNLSIAGIHEPPFVERPEDLDNDAITSEIREARPDILFVAFGAPKQEKWIDMNRAALGVPVMMGVGGSFDIIGGRLARAPGWMRSAGLEWMFRLAQEPRRLASRYLIGIPHFLATVLFLRFRRNGKD